MNIVYAVHHLPPRYTGGAEHRALRTARRMRALGHAVSLICIEAVDAAQPAYADSVDGGIPVRRLSFDRRAFADPWGWEYDNPFVERQLAAFLDEQRPDVFHLISGYLMTASAIRAARRAGIPIVVTLTDYWFLCPRINLLRGDGSVCPGPPADPMGCVRCMAETSRRFRLPAQAWPGLAATLWRRLGNALPATHQHAEHIRRRRQALRDALAQADRIICPSRFLRDLFIHNGVAADKLVWMRQGLDLAPQTGRRRATSPVPVFGYSGQIKPHKGVDVLIDAAAMLAARGHRFKLAVYGNPDEDRAYTHALQQRAGQAGWLEWRGKYAAGGVWDVLAGLDALVIPSRWYENSPNVILEAQAAGVPVVATRLGGMAELIEHDVNGLLFELNDAGDLARQLARLVDEPGLIDRLRANAPAVKTSEQESVELARLYGELVSSPVVEAAI